MIDPKQLERLHNSEDFLAFLDEINATRESWIGAMHEASTEKLQQISGRIIALDETLTFARYEDLSAKWAAVRQ